MTDLHGFGFALADVELSSEQCDYLVMSLPSVTDQRSGDRDLLSHPTVLQLVRHRQIGEFLWSLTGREVVAVSARLDESSGVPAPPEWHQDRRVTVRERMEVRGYAAWTARVGIWHVEPPSSVLDQMVIVRIHLDDCPQGSAAFQVIPGSHRGGKLSPQAIEELVEMQPALAPNIAKGSLVAMKPLLVHTISPCPRPSRFRVLQIVFAPVEAISPLQWRTTVSLHRAA